MFEFSAGTEAHHLPKGREFNPQLHFTGDPANRREVAAVQRLMDKYSQAIVAYATQDTPGFHGPAGLMYSVELQFSNRDEMLACRAAYRQLFDTDGNFVGRPRGRPSKHVHLIFPEP
jgi:hypothetical protein